MEKKLRRLCIKVQIMSSFMVVCLLLSVILAFTLYQLKDINEQYGKLITHTAVRLDNARTAHLDLAQTLAEVRAFLLYGDSESEKKVYNSYTSLNNKIMEYNKTSTQKDTIELSKKLMTDIAAWKPILDKMLEAKKKNDPSFEMWRSKSREMTTDIDKSLSELVNIQKKYMNEKHEVISNETKLDNEISIACAVVVFLFSIGFAYWYSSNMSNRLLHLKSSFEEVSRLDLSGKDFYPTRNDEIGDMAMAVIDMKKHIKEIVSHLQMSINTLASSSQQLNAMSEEQAKTVESVTRSIQEIAVGSVKTTEEVNSLSAVLGQVSANTRQISATVGEVDSNANNAVNEANRGMELLQGVTDQSDRIANSMTEIVEETKALTEASKKIGGIVDVINGIAGQTNLLALNAAIEAARAGDAGRGFAVVADEVRKLAEQSAGATKEITSLINAMNKNIESAVCVVKKANDETAKGKEAADTTNKGFHEIIAKLNVVRDQIKQAATGVEEIAKGTQSMVGSVKEVSAVAELTSAGSQTVAAASEEQTASTQEISANVTHLSKMANELNQVVQRFKV